MEKMKNYMLRLLCLTLLSGVFFSCTEEDEPDKPSPTQTSTETQTEEPAEDINPDALNPYTEGLYVLCEGTYGQNNSALDFFDNAVLQVKKNIFETVNKQGLGETANDMIKVNGLLYAAIDGSACVTVIDASTGILKKIIPITDSRGVNREPRHLAYYNDNVYVTCFDGSLVRISVSSNTVTGTVNTQGRNPEGIAVLSGKIYVANSGGLSYPNYDNTVSVIDEVSFTVEKLIPVMDNPQTVKAYKNSVYVLSTGDYTKTYRLTVIKNGEKTDSLDINMTDFMFFNDCLYYVYKPFTSSNTVLNKINVNDLHSQPVAFAQVPSNLATPYRICEQNGIIYVCDNKNATTSGEVFAFDDASGLLYSFPTSVGPNTVISKKDSK